MIVFRRKKFNILKFSEILTLEKVVSNNAISYILLGTSFTRNVSQFGPPIRYIYIYIYILNVVCCVGRVEIQIDQSKYKKVGVLPIRIV